MTATNRAVPPSKDFERWECPNHSSPVLLAMVDRNGQIDMRTRDRVWIVTGFGTVTATCPKCGAKHTLVCSHK